MNDMIYGKYHCPKCGMDIFPPNAGCPWCNGTMARDLKGVIGRVLDNVLCPCDMCDKLPCDSRKCKQYKDWYKTINEVKDDLYDDEGEYFF